MAPKPILKVVDDIVAKNQGIADFWGSAHGWAPIDAAELLSRSRLDWQVELSRTLALWVAASPGPGASGDGYLIMGWANLGSLVEGTLKWFLSVYYDDYSSSIQTLKKAQQYPDTLMLEPLRKFFVQFVWTKHDAWDPWIKSVQARRNAIHAYKSRPIGTTQEMEEAIRTYATFLDDMDGRVPYPDEIYRP